MPSCLGGPLKTTPGPVRACAWQPLCGIAGDARAHGLAGSYKNYVKNHGLRSSRSCCGSGPCWHAAARGSGLIRPKSSRASSARGPRGHARRRAAIQRRPEGPRGFRAPYSGRSGVLAAGRIVRWRRPPPDARRLWPQRGPEGFSAVQWAGTSDQVRRCKRCRPPHLDAATRSADPPNAN